MTNYRVSIDNDMITLPPQSDACEGWLLSASTMVVSKLDLSKAHEQSSAPRNSGTTISPWKEHGSTCNFPTNTWRRPSLPESDPGMIEDVFGSSDSESSSDEGPFSCYASSSTSSCPPGKENASLSSSSCPPEKEEAVWNQYFHRSTHSPIPPSPPADMFSSHPQHSYSFFPTPSTPIYKPNEYSHHATHKSWPQKAWPERNDSRPDHERVHSRPRAKTIPSRPTALFISDPYYSAPYPISGSCTPASLHQLHFPPSPCDSSTPLILKSEFETDSDDEDENSPNKMAKAIEEMFEKFRSSSGSSGTSAKPFTEEKRRRSKGGFRRSASEALKGVFGGKKAHAI